MELLGLLLVLAFAWAVYNRAGQPAPSEAEKNAPTITIEELR